MTAQEQQLLQGLTDRVNQTALEEKDPEAAQYLHDTLGRNPDSIYILAQTVLVQQYALDQATKQLAAARAELDQARQQQQQQMQQPKHTGSFLGNILGFSDDSSRQSAPPPPSPAYNQPAYAPVSYQPAPYGGGAPGYGVPQSGGFFRSALQTATGVAAGALAFEGIESLMHGFGHSEGFGSGLGGRPEEVVNNYYGDAAPAGHAEHLSSDIEDRRNESSSFSDAVTNDDHHDGAEGFLGDDSTDSSSDIQDDNSDTSDYSSDDTSSGSDDTN